MATKHYRAVVYLDVQTTEDDTPMGIEAGLTQVLSDIIPEAVNREAPALHVTVTDVALRYEPLDSDKAPL